MAADAGTDLDEHPIIVFDGFCVLCSASAQFVLKHKLQGHLRLAEIARNRYRVFGRRGTCWVSMRKQAARIL